MAFLLTLLLNKALKLPKDFEKLPLNLNTFELDPSNSFVTEFLWDFLEGLELREKFYYKELGEKKSYPVKEFSFHGFSWLATLSSINNKKARDFTKMVIDKLGFFGNRYSANSWQLDIASSRLSAICLNIRFLDLSKNLGDQKNIILFIRFHVIYLTFCKLFCFKGLKSLRLHSSIFFASLILGDAYAKRHWILKRIIKDASFLLNKNGEIKSRNAAELLEILFLVNRLIRFSSTAELSRGKVDAELKRIQNKVAPVLRGLRLGSGRLVRACGSGGETTQWNLDKELFDAKLSDFSIRKRAMGFHRVSAGRLRLIFDGKSALDSVQSNELSCPAFSFELSSGQRTIFQNNVPFKFFLGDSDGIARSPKQYNSVQYSLAGRFRKASKWSVKIVRVKDYRDHENHYLEGEKVINIDQLNLSHWRKLIIPSSGNGVIGRDLISIDSGKMAEYGPINVQFFLHPSVDVWKTNESNYFLLQLKNKELWNFETDMNNGFLENYNYLDPTDLQERIGYKIVLQRRLTTQTFSIDWRLFIQSHSTRITREKINF